MRVTTKKMLQEGLNLYDRMENIGKNNLSERHSCLKTVYGRDIANSQHMVPLNEITMNRLLGKHYNKGGFAIVSASRNEHTREENERLTQEMYAQIRKSEFRFIPAFGGFIETNKQGERHEVYESVAIILCFDRNGEEIPFERLREFAMNIGIQYDQDSVLIKAPNQNPQYIITSERVGSVGDLDTEFSGNVKVNDLTQKFFTNMSSRDGNIGKNRFSFTEQYVNPTFATLNEGHMRHLNGEVYLDPAQMP